LQNLNIESSRWTTFNNFIVIAVSLYGFAVQSYREEEISFFQKVIIELTAPLQSGTSSVQVSVTDAFDHYVKIVNTSRENALLKKKISSLNSTIFDLKEVQQENERLKQLLEFGEVIPKKKVLAQVISMDSANEFKVLRINKGEAHGLKLMSPVITMTGLVGYVYRLSANYSDILTILDQNNRVDAIVTRTRTHGIVEGDAKHELKFKYVARTDDVELEDIVITAGLGEIYPKGIKIGTISSIDKKNSGITQKISIEPSVDFHKLEEVLVLIEGEAGDVAKKDLPLGDGISEKSSEEEIK
tara:strand:- start:11374 stop:12273 length:900 start_codon:yes stop_codon:yes gene_type:complete